MENSKKMMGWVAYVVVVVVFLAGFGIAKATNKDMDKSKSSNTMSAEKAVSSKAATLRATMVGLGVEHMQLTNQAVDDALDGSPGAADTASALYKNGTDIGAAVGSVYGMDAENTFNSVWKLHLDEFVNYAVASSKGDEAGKTKALDSIDSGYTKPLAQYLAKANPNIDEGQLEGLLRHHVEQTAESIDLHVQKKYAEEAGKVDHANDHITEIFTALSEAIVKHYPSKF